MSCVREGGWAGLHELPLHFWLRCQEAVFPGVPQAAPLQCETSYEAGVLVHTPLPYLGDVPLQARMDEDRAWILLKNYRGHGVVKYFASVFKRHLARPCLSQNLAPICVQEG